MAVLAALTIVLYLPAVHHGHLAYDDLAYVFDNPHIITGPSWTNILWAFTTVHEQYWLPVLRLSFMADVVLMGTADWGFHLTNILLHAANTALLFACFRLMTGRRGASALVAALFAVHPLNVEAVAWITARKDVLSTFFGLLALLIYLRHAHAPASKNIWIIAAIMLLGLMSKPTLIALPCILLLLDFWPLQRRATGLPWHRLIAEKWLLLILSAVFVAINLSTHTSGRGATCSLSAYHRLLLIPTNYGEYLLALFAPFRLAIVHPEHDVIHWNQTIPALVVLGGLTWTIIRKRQELPFLATGWGWFLITLLPVIRGVRMGITAMADRFTYIPGVGIFLMLVWGGTELGRRRPAWRPALRTTAVLLLVTCAGLTTAQLQVWRSSQRLFEQALANGGPHLVTLYQLANIRDLAGQPLEALAIYEFALQLGLGEPDTHYNIARIKARIGQTKEAFTHYRLALAVKPNLPEAWNNLGLLYQAEGDLNAATTSFQRALALQPTNGAFHNNLGIVYAMQGQMSKAADAFAHALELTPNDTTIRANLERARRALLTPKMK